MNLYRKLTRNMIVDNILTALGLDAGMKPASRRWASFNYDYNKTTQENAGFSHTEQVEEALRRVKAKLQTTLVERVPKDGNVLDLGCGPGIYMEMLRGDFRVFGVDVSQAMIDAAKRQLPSARFYRGDFLKVNFEETYKAIYSISVLQYVPVSKIEKFFVKCARILDEHGILFVQYPHALCKNDVLYPDCRYINYSPALIEDVCARYMRILEHAQSYDGRILEEYDDTPYPTPSKTFKNGYLLIAEKSNAAAVSERANSTLEVVA